MLHLVKGAHLVPESDARLTQTERDKEEGDDGSKVAAGVKKRDHSDCEF